MANLGDVMRDAMFLSRSDKAKLIAFLTHEPKDTSSSKVQYITDKKSIFIRFVLTMDKTSFGYKLAKREAVPLLTAA